MNLLFLWVFLLVILDQTSKSFITGTINYGAAFGILRGWKWLFILIGIFMLGFLYYYKDKVKGYGYIGLILLFSGIIGNLIDRVLYGYVRDFIDLGFWPSFNLADSYSSVGVILMIVYFWKFEHIKLNN